VIAGPCSLVFAADLTHALTPGGPSDPYPSDHALGQRIGALIAGQGGAAFVATPILSQVQDLLEEDTSLLGPLRDLLLRPSFRHLVGGEQRSVLLGGRDALLQDLGATYQPAVVSRLTAVIDGCLGLPPAPSGYGASASTPPVYSQPSGDAPPSNAPWSQGYAPPPGSSTPSTPVSSGSGGRSLTALLVVLVSLLSGGLLMGLGWLLLANRANLIPPPKASTSAPAPSTANGSASAPAPVTPKPPEPSPGSGSSGTTATASPGADGAWGSASDYKFGTLPGGDYPNSCAFSQTDSEGKVATSKTAVEYWACRDLGGDPETGYKVVWADGKETTYTFAQGGSGTVVGTNGSSYPMQWQNDTHMGTDIIVINHQDGAQSWIPGHINGSK